jgi:flap endonuclease-1
MGVKDLFKLPISNEEHEYYDPEAGNTLNNLGERIELSSLEGHRIAIDASDYIYNSLLAMSHVEALTDSEGNPTSHILRIFNTVQMLHRAKVKQLWVFDSSKPNKFKKFEAEKRRDRRQIGKSRGQEKQAFVMTGKHVADIKKLLTLMGVTYVEAPEGIEAEHYGAYMTSGEIGERFCTYMLSADSDVLIFGGNLLRHVTERSASGKTKKTVYKVYELEDVLSALDVDYDEFLKIAVALGTDFQESKIKGVGPKTVVKKVKNDTVNIPEDLEEVMDYLRSDPPADGGDLQENTLDPEGLRAYLLGLNFAEDRIDKAITTMQDAL